MIGLASKQVTQPVILPAPLGGINTLESPMNLSVNDCLQMINFTPKEYGLQVRKGFDKHTTAAFGGVSAGVRTIIPFEGSTEAGSDDKLFAATLEGVYDVSSATPSLAQAWTTKSGNAGYCHTTTMTTLANKYQIICDEVNGLYIYAPSGTAWVKVTRGAANYPTSGCIQENASVTVQCDPTKFIYTTVWKNRLWFVEKDSTRAWYLPDKQIATGTSPDARVVDFGNKFRSGGFLTTLHNFTVDAGSGIDDYLVGISSTGDVVVYQGTDPTDPAKFSIVGVWKIGKVPVGRRYAAEVGGDLYILCSYGIVSLAQLMKGVDPGVTPAYITGKITNLVRKDLNTLINTRGWQLINHSADGVLIMSVPVQNVLSGTYGQYIMSVSTRAWGQWTGVPMDCMAVYKDTLYFGTVERDSGSKGEVYTLTGTQDESGRADVDVSDISAFLLTSYSSADSPGRYKRVQFAVPQFLAVSSPIYDVSARYDFDLDNYIASLSGVIPTPSFPIWDTSDWSTAVWGEGSLAAYNSIAGTSGMGRFMALALTVKAAYDATFVGFTAMYDSGGAL